MDEPLNFEYEVLKHYLHKEMWARAGLIEIVANLMRICFIFAIFTAILIPNAAFSEQFYYFEDHKLARNPVVCTFEFEDANLPEAKDQLLQETKEAISDWQNMLVEYTGNEDVWKMQYKVFPKENQHDFFAEYDCDITVYFEQEPPKEDIRVSGYTDAFSFGLSEIVIFYREPIFADETQNSVTLQNFEAIGFRNSIDPYVGETIRHEFGHALGLDHLPKEAISYKYKEGIPIGSSIMIDDYEGLPWDIVFEITEYDVMALVNLYGEDGFVDPFTLLFLDLIGYVVLVGIILLIVYFVIRRRKRKKFEFR